LNQIALLIAIPIFSVAFLSLSVSSALGSSSLNIFPQGSKPYGLTYAQHAKNFWNWTLGISGVDNPINDPTGAKCGTGQSNTNSSVFYLAFNNGGRSERTCEVPAGKGLLIPVMQVEYSEKELPGATVDELSAAAKKDQDSVNTLSLQVDDRSYNYDDLIKYRVHTDDFNVDYADNGIFGVVEGGPSKVVADGFYILTKPITAGNHTVHFKSSLICNDPGCAEPNFAQDIKYNIIAK
jgi:hypothetical protein